MLQKWVKGKLEQVIKEYVDEREKRMLALMALEQEKYMNLLKAYETKLAGMLAEFAIKNQANPGISPKQIRLMTRIQRCIRRHGPGNKTRIMKLLGNVRAQETEEALMQLFKMGKVREDQKKVWSLI